jgi:hypothetical protein
MPFLKIEALSAPLTSEESNTLLYIEYAATCGITDEVNDAVEMIKQWSQEQIVRFSRQNAALNTVCQSQEESENLLNAVAAFNKFCLSHPPLQIIWAKTLSEHKSPNKETIATSTDQPESHSLFDHYISDYLINVVSSFYLLPHTEKSNADRTNVVTLLNEACKLGSYDGLVLNCNLKCNLLKNTQTLAEEDHLIKNIQKNCDRLANLYGAIGYLQSGLLLLTLANFFSEKQEDVEKDRSIYYREAAIKNCLCALLLEKDPYSSALIKSITNNEGLLSVFKERHFSDWNKAKEFFLELVKPETYKTLEGQANLETQPILNHSRSKPLTVVLPFFNPQKTDQIEPQNIAPNPSPNNTL